MAVLPDESHIRTDFTPYVPRLVIEWLAENPDREWREIDGTMAFVDISGFTAMSEKLATQGKAGAEQVTEVMNSTFDALLRVAYDYGGGLLKFGGDALLVFFDDDGHERRAARAAFEMRKTLRSIGRPKTTAGHGDVEDACGPQLRPFSLHARRRRASRADRQRACRNDHGRDGERLRGRRDPPRPGHGGRPARRGARRGAGGRLPRSRLPRTPSGG